MTFVIRTSVSREVDKCQYGQVPVVQWIRNRMDVAPWCFKWGRIGMEWNEMGWKSLGYAIAPTMQKSQPTHKGVARITTYVHLCLKSQYTATFVQKKFRTYAGVWSRKTATYLHFFFSCKNQNIHALWSKKKMI